MKAERLNLVDACGNCLADFNMVAEEDGWFVGSLHSAQFTPEIRAALDWYDEVIENQMLSYLDQATKAVERFGFRVRFANGTMSTVYSLHVGANNEVSFRITPVPPPSWQAQSMIA
jgi:hypothetical protein